MAYATGNRPEGRQLPLLTLRPRVLPPFSVRSVFLAYPLLFFSRRGFMDSLHSVVDSAWIKRGKSMENLFHSLPTLYPLVANHSITTQPVHNSTPSAM